MPGTVTHNYILYKALQSYSPRSTLMKMVKASHAEVLTHARKPQGWSSTISAPLSFMEEIKRPLVWPTMPSTHYDKDPLCLPAGCAYLGACGPDLFYLEFGPDGTFIADLMHYNKTSLFMIWCLRQVKKVLDAVEAGKELELLNLFAYCLGHISHIAADIITHPYVNSIVGAYADNEKAFEGARFASTGKNAWRFHNILEQYQDAYILYRRFFGMEKFHSHWRSVHVASAAATHYMNKKHRSKWFLVRNAQGFYQFTKVFSPSVELNKYCCFLDINDITNLNSYFEAVMPTRDMMEACPRLVQGGIYGPDGQLQHPGLFDKYLDDSIAQTHKFWAEVENYLAAPQQDYADLRLTPDKKSFPTLRRHWNLDTGMAPLADNKSLSWNLPEQDNVRLCIAGGLSFESVHTKPKEDVTLSWMSATKK